MKDKLFTPVERIDGLQEKRNMAEKYMHLYRYQHAGKILRQQWKKTSEARRVLDLACGYGYGSLELHTITGAEVIGVDISSDAIQYAVSHYKQSKVSFKKGTVTAIPYPDSSFDSVVCYETIEHVSFTEGMTALNELCRVLKPGGTLFISTPNRLYTYALQLFGMKNPFHIYEYMPAELRGLVLQRKTTSVATYGQSICFPVTYYLARAGWLPPRYFYPSRYLPAELSMIAILQFVKK